MGIQFFVGVVFMPHSVDLWSKMTHTQISLDVFVQINGSVWRLGDALCDTWVAFDVMCCTSSILNLTAISVDR